jgi:hypothetical protein
MTDYAVRPARTTRVTGAVCHSSPAGPVPKRAALATSAGVHQTRFWQRFFIASFPAALLALLVESTIYGFVLYLGIYVTYCVWSEVAASVQPADNHVRAVASQQLTAGSTANS